MALTFLYLMQLIIGNDTYISIHTAVNIGNGTYISIHTAVNIGNDTYISLDMQ